MDQEYMTAFKGRFTSAMRWPQLDTLWDVLHQLNDGGWFVYAVGEKPPEKPVTSEQFNLFLGRSTNRWDRNTNPITAASSTRTVCPNQPLSRSTTPTILASPVASATIHRCRAGFSAGYSQSICLKRCSRPKTGVAGGKSSFTNPGESFPCKPSVFSLTAVLKYLLI